MIDRTPMLDYREIPEGFHHRDTCLSCNPDWLMYDPFVPFIRRDGTIAAQSSRYNHVEFTCAACGKVWEFYRGGEWKLEGNPD